MTQYPNAKPAGYEAALDLLMTQGWCVIPSALPRETIEALDADLAPIYEATPYCEGDFYGGRTKRFGSLLKRSPHAAALAMDDLILAVSEAVLSPWCDTLQLNLMQAIALHPGAPAQFPHRDQDMRCCARRSPAGAPGGSWCATRQDRHTTRPARRWS